MGAISLLNQLYNQKTNEYAELQDRAKVITERNEKKLYRETPMRAIEKDIKKLEKKRDSLKDKYETSDYEIKKQMQRAITDKKVEIEAKLVSATKEEATKLILEFQKWWPKL